VITVLWESGPLTLGSPSVEFGAVATRVASSVVEEDTVWSSRSVSWVNVTVLLLSNVMLVIQESVLGGLDDGVVDLWWFGVDLLTSQFISSGWVIWEIWWKSLIWLILSIWVISSSSLSLASGDDSVGQIILKWDGSVNTNGALAIWKFNPSSSDS